MVDEDITEEDIWADIDNVFYYPPRETGDIDVTQFSRRYGIHENTAWARMRKMVATGNYVFVIVADDKNVKGKRKVIRKIR